MKTLLKLIVAGLVLNAVIHGAAVAWDYYRLKDETQRILTFGSNMTRAELRDGILEAAADLDVPLRSEALTVTRAGVRTSWPGSCPAAMREATGARKIRAAAR